MFSLFALISLASLALYGPASAGTVARRCVFPLGLSWETLILATLLLFCAVLNHCAGGSCHPMIYGLLGWGRLLRWRAVIQPRDVTVCSVDAGGDCAGDASSLANVLSFRRCWRMRACSSFAAGIAVSSVSRQEIQPNYSRVSR
ncbi:hypothetical protein ACNKHM_09895 [Shigella sonnei]